MSDASSGTIIVASSVDQGYLPFALVVAQSIARHADAARPIEYHILYDGPDHWAVPALEAFARGPLKVRVHRMANPWSRFGIISGFPPATLFRLAIPDVLAHCDRAIYLDCDTLVEAPLGPLFDADLHGNPMGAVPCVLTVTAAITTGTAKSNGVLMATADYLREVIGLDTRVRQLGYRQCGVQLLDLAALRDMNYAGQMTAVLDRLGNRLAYADQCAANLLLRDRFADIEPRWNVSSYALHRRAPDNAPPELRSLLLAQRPRGIIHFGGEKPWSDLFMPGALRWWRAAFATGHGRYFLGKLRPSLFILERHLSYASPALRWLVGKRRGLALRLRRLVTRSS